VTRADSLKLARDWLTGGGLVAMLMGAIIAVPLTLYADDWVRALTDRIHPVARARVLHASRVDGELRVSLAVTRLRGECKVLGGYAWGTTPEGYALRINAERTDGRSAADIPPGQEVRVGEWRLWPVAGVASVRLYAHYDCEGRLTSVLLAEVPT
jgi:hypothetical protein